MNSQYHNYISHLVTIMTQYDIEVSNIITNSLCYMLFNQYYSIIPPYNMIYDTHDINSFISIIKNRYNFDILKLNPLDIEKISQYKNASTNDANDAYDAYDANDASYRDKNSILYTIYSVLKNSISKYNIKNTLQFNITNYHVMQYIINNLNILKSTNILCLSSQLGEFNNLLMNKYINADIYDMNANNILWSSLEYEINSNSMNSNPNSMNPNSMNSNHLLKCDNSNSMNSNHLLK